MDGHPLPFILFGRYDLPGELERGAEGQKGVKLA